MSCRFLKEFATLTSGASIAALTVTLMPVSAAFAQAAGSDEDVIEREDNNTIVVTAQRREQTLLEIPQSISVVGGETLERQQATSFQDYAQLVPGLNITQDTPGETRLILRGINTGSPGSTVSVYVDDIPFGASGSLSNAGTLAGDFDTFDVARVEVLRGPQGTLYGSNSLGGVLKFVTVKPSTRDFELRGQTGIEDTKGGGTGYSGNAVVNIPISDMLAFRASGFYRKNAGHVNTIGRNANNIDDSESYGGRASVLFEPSDDFSIRLLGILQNLSTGSSSSFNVDPVSLKPVNPITGIRQDRTSYSRIAETNDLKYRLYSGTISYNFGFAEAISVTSYSTQDRIDLSDASTNAARDLTNAIYAPTSPGTVGLGYKNNISVKKFTQELRLASPDSDIFEWQIGGYYTDESTLLDQEFLPFSLATQQFIPTPATFGPFTFDKFVTAMIDANYEEIAGFVSGTIHLGERFDITAGGRYSHNKQDSVQSVIQFGTGSPVSGNSSENVFTWSVSPRFELNDRASIYARVAKGYRPGGPNFIPVNPPPGFPSEFDADTLISYEAGFRGETNDRTFGIDASIYYLDWKDIQILTTVDTDAGPVGVNSNGRKAESYGAEITATIQPVAGLSFIANVAYNIAKLLEDTTPVAGGTNLTGGLAGDRLPYAPEWSANVSADYEWALSGSVDAFVGGNVRLVSDQFAGFSPGYRAAFGRRLELDGYPVVDLRAGINFDRILISAFVKNLTDQYGLTTATYGTTPFSVPVAIGGQGIPLATASSIRPRTFGATVGFSF